jgi:peptidoglycan/xylan/chitin deacetylase (PgdA/CDA1 family)
MVRGYLKAALASAAHVSRADRLAAAITTRRREALVLGYHRVVDDFAREASYSFPSMLISRRMLERHLDWIGRRFQVVGLDDLRSRVETRSRTDPPIAAISFDDGYRDVYEHAFPLLIRKGLPATVFVATNYVGTSGVFPHDRLYLLLARASHRWRSFSRQLLRVLRRLDLPLPMPTLFAASRSAHLALRTLITSLSEGDVQRIIGALEVDCGLSGGLPNGFRPMTWEMLAEMSRAGISVGSHTKSHALLTNEAPTKVIDETSGSRDILTTRLGRPSAAFAYPDGRFDRAAVRAVAAAGYQIAVTTCGHRDPDYPWLTVPRLLLWERSSVDLQGCFSQAVFSCQVSGLFNRVSSCQQRHRGAESHYPSHGERHTSADRLQRTVSLSGH